MSFGFLFALYGIYLVSQGAKAKIKQQLRESDPLIESEVVDKDFSLAAVLPNDVVLSDDTDSEIAENIH